MSVYIGGTKVAGLEKELPSQTGNAGKYLYTDGENASWEEASTAQIWIGTRAEYEALGTYDPEITYEVIDDYSGLDPVVRREVTERNIGELVYSTIPVTDAGLHLADGDLLDGTGIYADFYDYMLSVYNAGHTSIFTTEATWQTANTNYGKCGKYVLDTTNHTIRLPKIPGFVEGTLTESEIGDRVAPGLPNITGAIQTGHSLALFGQDGTGAIRRDNNNGASVGGSSGSTYRKGFTFDASLSNSIYGASSTVQPESVKLYVYIVIANTVKTPVQVDIDEIATELNACYGHRVIAFQAPTSSNGYTWYRKYADGWAEQGGIYDNGSLSDDFSTTVTLPITMADTNYTAIAIASRNNGNAGNRAGYTNVFTQTTTQLGIGYFRSQSNNQMRYLNWRVEGMAA